MERVRGNQNVLKCAVSLAKVYAQIYDCIRNLIWAIWNLWLEGVYVTIGNPAFCFFLCLTQHGGDVSEWKIKCRPIRIREIGGVSLSDVRLTIKVCKARPRQKENDLWYRKTGIDLSRTETGQKTTVYIAFSMAFYSDRYIKIVILFFALFWKNWFFVSNIVEKFLK